MNGYNDEWKFKEASAIKYIIAKVTRINSQMLFTINNFTDVKRVFR